MIWTLHLWQVPWPPQVESIAMPFHDAASKTVTPGGTRTPRWVGGTAAPSSARLWTVKARSTRPVPSCVAGSAPGRSIRPSRADVREGEVGPVGRLGHCAAAGCRRLPGAVGRDPGQPHSSWPSSRSAALTASTICGRAGVHDRAGESGRHRHRQEGRVEGVPAGHAEGDVGGAAGHVDAELVADPAHRLEGHQCDVLGVGADRHGQRVDDDVGLRRCRTPRWRPR